jgi:hypothetical protein
VSGNKTHHKLTKNKPALAQSLRGSRQFSMSRSLIFYGVSTRAMEASKANELRLKKAAAHWLDVK